MPIEVAISERFYVQQADDSLLQRGDWAQWIDLGLRQGQLPTGPGITVDVRGVAGGTEIVRIHRTKQAGGELTGHQWAVTLETSPYNANERYVRVSGRIVGPGPGYDDLGEFGCRALHPDLGAPVLNASSGTLRIYGRLMPYVPGYSNTHPAGQGPYRYLVLHFDFGSALDPTRQWLFRGLGVVSELT